MPKLTVQELIAAGVHFGCRVSRWNPKMAPYIHGRRNQIHVIDLRETLKGTIRAQNLLFHIASEGQAVLWVGTKRQVKGVIEDAGQRTGMPIVTERWIGGTLTNFSIIRSRLKRLEELERLDEESVSEASKLTKKELSRLRRERRKITRNLGGIREMTSMPGAMVVVDPSREGNAVREARKMGIVIIGVLDTDCDPGMVDIVIPGNDDALKSVRLMIEQLISAVEEGGAQHRDQLAIMGVAQKRDESAMPSDEPRPTRGKGPLRRPTKAASPESGEGAGSEESGEGSEGDESPEPSASAADEIKPASHEAPPASADGAPAPKPGVAAKTEPSPKAGAPKVEVAADGGEDSTS